MDRKPTLFIGCSSEAQRIARAFHRNLMDHCEVTVWKDGFFGLSDSTIESLESQCGNYDYALFILSPDDKSVRRDKDILTPRDNVIFELGLFIGRIGRRRCFIATPSDGGVVVPSDLNGVTVALYENGRSDNNWKAAVGPAADEILQAVCESTFCTVDASVSWIDKDMHIHLSGKAVGGEHVAVCWRNQQNPHSEKGSKYWSRLVAIPAENGSSWATAFQLTEDTALLRHVTVFLCSEANGNEIVQLVNQGLFMTHEKLVEALRGKYVAVSESVCVLGKQA